ncbi:inositol phospholipid synthesis and fat-storage-inducing TM-domain-containing protein [Dichotomocladium elegans]|nr:inositol phospholipid synthesis and fat-storage-inducing TM-domain-containing protein [Dichotomocladium elegans]
MAFLFNRWVIAAIYPLTVFAFSTLVAGQVPETYFSDSNNALNVYFVKLGWLWTTLAFASMVPGWRAWARYTMTTLYWYAMTQWLLGPSFVDRVFIATGGGCSSSDLLTSQSTCRLSGGQWIGGHDVSGHCVLLIHASLFLWEEMRQRRRNNPNYKNSFVMALLVLWWWMLDMTSIYFFHGPHELLSGVLFGMLGWALLYLGLYQLVPFFQEPL